MGLVTIQIYQDLQHATLARMKLESEGIPAHIQSTGMIRMTGLLNALGGARLQVPEDQQEKAAEIVSLFNKEIGIAD